MVAVSVLFPLLLPYILSQAIKSMPESRIPQCSRFSPAKFLFSLLDETFITQVCGLKNNECRCF